MFNISTVYFLCVYTCVFTCMYLGMQYEYVCVCVFTCMLLEAVRSFPTALTQNIHTETVLITWPMTLAYS